MMDEVTDEAKRVLDDSRDADNEAAQVIEKAERVKRRRATDWPVEWITVSAFARKYGVDRHIVYKWLEAKILDVYTVGTVTRLRDLPPDQHSSRAKCA